MTVVVATMLVIVCAAVFGVVYTAYSATVDKLRKSLEEERRINAALHWFSQWQAAYRVAAQDAAMTGLNITYLQLWQRVERRLSNPYWRGLIQRVIPLDSVPAELKQGAQHYNARVAFGQLPQYDAKPGETQVQAQIRKLEDIVMTLSWQLDDIARDDKLVHSIAAKVGTSFEVTQFVLRSYAEYKLNATYPAPVDPEEVLPSIY